MVAGTLGEAFRFFLFVNRKPAAHLRHVPTAAPTARTTKSPTAASNSRPSAE